jgi:ATP-dependent RNA helicase DDX23/PRP28
LNRDKRKSIKPSDKFKNVFNFDWNESEDTSHDINPIYQNRLEPHLLFGKGIKAGFDSKEQKKRS